MTTRAELGEALWALEVSTAPGSMGRWAPDTFQELPEWTQERWMERADILLGSTALRSLISEKKAEALKEASSRLYDEWEGGHAYGGLAIMYAEDWLNDRAAAYLAEQTESENTDDQQD